MRVIFMPFVVQKELFLGHRANSDRRARYPCGCAAH